MDRMRLLEVVERARRGDREAFDDIVRRTEHRLARAVYRLGVPLHEVLDVLEEVYVEVWRALPALRRPERFLGFLRVVLRRAVVDHLARRERETDLFDSAFDPDRIAVDTGDEEAEQRRREVAQLLRGLAEEDLDLLERRYVRRFSIPRLARELGVSPHRLRYRLERLIQFLEVRRASRRESAPEEPEESPPGSAEKRGGAGPGEAGKSGRRPIDGW